MTLSQQEIQTKLKEGGAKINPLRKLKMTFPFSDTAALEDTSPEFLGDATQLNDYQGAAGLEENDPEILSQGH